MIDLSFFDVLGYLDGAGIEYTEAGKNVGTGWVGVRCPFPSCDDDSNHLGINLSSKKISCFKCGTKGYITKYIQEINGYSFAEVLSVIQEYSGREVNIAPDIKRTPGEICTIPSGVSDDFEKIHLDYLIKRRFDPDKLREIYKIKAGGPVGRFKFRIFIPIIMDRKMVAFTGRSVSDKAPLRYKNSLIEESIVPVKESLYNIDSIQDTALVVEGPTHVWRIGSGAVCTFGTKFTPAQIIRLKGKRVFIMFDAEDTAQSAAEKFLYMATGVAKEVKLIQLESGQPDDLSEDDVRHLRREVQL